jgi:hypothetical protein
MPVIDTIHDHAMRLPEGPGWTFMVPWGGSVSLAGAYSLIHHRAASWIVHPGAFWTDPGRDDEAAAWARGFRQALDPFASGGAWLTFIGDEGRRPRSGRLRPKNYERLKAIKSRYDPSKCVPEQPQRPAAPGVTTHRHRSGPTVRSTVQVVGSEDLRRTPLRTRNSRRRRRRIRTALTETQALPSQRDACQRRPRRNPHAANPRLRTPCDRHTPAETT